MRTEEQLLELATSLPAMRTIRHQPRGLRQKTCVKKLLQHHTHFRHLWNKRRGSESLQAELAAARWDWLGPTLLVRACDGSEHADDEGLTPGQRRKPSLELAGKRATLAETGAWTELLRTYLRDTLSGEVDARHTERGHDACFRQDGLVQHPGSFTDTADLHAQPTERANNSRDTLAGGR